MTCPKLHIEIMGETGFELRDLDVNPEDADKVFLTCVSYGLQGFFFLMHFRGQKRSRPVAKPLEL